MRRFALGAGAGTRRRNAGAGIDSRPTAIVPTGGPIALSVIPQSATRSGVVWESSAAAIVSIGKFGVAMAQAAREAVLTAFSWHDAEPLSADESQESLRAGVQASIRVRAE